MRRESEVKIVVFTARLWWAFLAVALYATGTSSAYAGEKLYMQIEGSQGPFQGEGTKPGSPWIVIQAVNESITSPAGRATGMAAGRKQPGAIRITKEVGASSPKLQQAAARGEHLKKVVIELARTNASGQEQVYRTILLTDVMISGIQMKAGGAGGSAKPTEEISFSYQKIEEQYSPQGRTTPGKVVEKGAWQSPR